MNLNNVKEKVNKFDFCSKLKICAIISLTIILIGIIVVSVFGFNLGIDFTGGTVLNVKVGSVLEEKEENYATLSSEITSIFKSEGFEIGYIQQEGVGEEAQIAIRFKDKANLTEAQMQEEISNLKEKLEANLTLGGSHVEVTVSNGSRIAASASLTLLINSLLAVLVAVILILVYIAIRFELLSGLTAILMLVHDVFIMCSLVAIFRIQVNASFIAALITIIGYSINNVIMVFDRIRENKKRDDYKDKSNTELVNSSIKQVLSRTLLTSLTTLVGILALTIIGVTSIREFLIPIIFGLISGIYSSTMLAGPIWALINDKTVRKVKKG